MSTLDAPVTGGVAEYEEALREALSGLPPAEAEDLLRDVHGHLLEIEAEAAQTGGPADLVAVLGDPRAYAEELRSAADLPRRTEILPKTEPAPGWLAIVVPVLLLVGGAFFSIGVGINSGNEGYMPVALGILFVGLVLTALVRSSEERRRVIDEKWSGWRANLRRTTVGSDLLAVLASVEAGWWLLRAWPAVMLLDRITSHRFSVSYPLPEFFALGPFGGIVVLVLAALASVWFGVRFERDKPAARWHFGVFNIVLLATFAVLVSNPEHWVGDSGLPGLTFLSWHTQP